MQTACSSSSLVAIHEACNSLLLGNVEWHCRRNCCP
ncbi:hypothetical protein CS542_07145 [Pedobacter sp. IW39]|nr:hypothetical protein CS542_07145 [Pedobacter sp. IW39]